MNKILEKLFKGVIAFAVWDYHILWLIILGVILMVDHATVVELIGGNYTNVVSATVGLLILREEIAQKKSHGDIHDKLDTIIEKQQ